jgi:hypothetical protein
MKPEFQRTLKETLLSSPGGGAGSVQRVVALGMHRSGTWASCHVSGGGGGCGACGTRSYFWHLGVMGWSVYVC